MIIIQGGTFPAHKVFIELIIIRTVLDQME